MYPVSPLFRRPCPRSMHFYLNSKFVSRIDSYAMVERNGLLLQAAMLSGLVCSWLKKHGVKLRTIELLRCDLSIASLNVGHSDLFSDSRSEIPVLVVLQLVSPIGSHHLRRSMQ